MIRASAVWASRKEILAQPSTNECTKFRLGYFSPRKQRSKSDLSSSSLGCDSDRILLDELDLSSSSLGYDSDRIFLDEDIPAEESSQSSDSDSFPVQRWNTPQPCLSEQGDDLVMDPELTIPSSPSLVSTDYMSSSEAPSEREVELQAPRKKKKTTHISADKALVLGGGPQQHDDAGPSSSTSRATRQVKVVNYARVKRKYTKKQ